jgi:hypothetical protein
MRKPPTEELCRGLDRLGEGTVVSEVLATRRARSYLDLPRLSSPSSSVVSSRVQVPVCSGALSIVHCAG